MAKFRIFMGWFLSIFYLILSISIVTFIDVQIGFNGMFGFMTGIFIGFTFTDVKGFIFEIFES